ncbi:MAG: ERAP1-like C-terminal domain-containing protein [Myxococcales bacterium]|nr:ERAP1-like C-terminal domain-containing protein [Myxococcales bacterium]
MRAVWIVVAIACGASGGGCGGSTPTARPPTSRPAPTTPPPAAPTLTPLTAPPGVRLPREFQVERYAPSLVIDPAQPTFSGTIEIAGTLRAPQATIWLHAIGLTIDGAVATTDAGEVALTARTDVAPGRLALTAPQPLPAGRLVLTIRYRGLLDLVDTTGTFRQQVDGAWYAFTQHEALHARRTFPCVDEPDVKVPWTLTLQVPMTLTAAANAPIATEELTLAGKTLRFAPTPPLPSYLVAFAIGPFDVVEAGATSGGAPIRILAPAGRGAEAGFAAAATPKLVAALERWFGTPYPYAKLDSVAIPATVGFGAMENPGLVTYVEDLLLMPADASPLRQRRYASVGAHELAHQWFGDLVTPVWWDDIWLNESFASWLPDKIVGEVFPSWRKPIEAIEARDGALEADSLATARRIRQPIESEDDIVGAFDGITYGKGAAVLRMFEAHVGAARFQEGVRAYLAAHAHGNATAADFLGAIAAAAPDADVTASMSTLLDQAGAPRVTATIACSADRAEVVLAQDRYLPLGATTTATTPRWRLPVCVLAEVAGKRTRHCTLLADATATIALARCPTWVWPNADGLGYYRSSVAAAQWPKVLAAAGALDPSTRVAITSDLLAEIDAGRADIGLALAAVPALVKRGTRAELAMAVDLAGGVRPWVPAADRPRYERWIRSTFALGKRLGLVPAAGDDADRERLRGAVVALLADTGAEPTLRRDAVTRARTWRTQPAATRGLILRLAVRADPTVHDALLAEFPRETDRVILRDLAGALGAVLDPPRLEAALALTLDPALDIRVTLDILGAATGHEATRPVVEAFVRAHVDELLARMPRQAGARLVTWLTASCDAAAIEPARALAEAKLLGRPGARRRIDQALERLAQCAAVRGFIEPGVAAWAHRL